MIYVFIANLVLNVFVIESIFRHERKLYIIQKNTLIDAYLAISQAFLNIYDKYTQTILKDLDYYGYGKMKKSDDGKGDNNKEPQKEETINNKSSFWFFNYKVD